MLSDYRPGLHPCGAELNVHRKELVSVYGAFHYQSPRTHSQGQILYHVNIKMLTEMYETEVCIYQHEREKHLKMWYKNINSKLVTAVWEKCNFKNISTLGVLCFPFISYTVHGSYVRNHLNPYMQIHTVFSSDILLLHSNVNSRISS